jgi:hypothetical protein
VHALSLQLSRHPRTTPRGRRALSEIAHLISVQQALAIDRIRHGSDQEKEQRVGIMRSAASGMTI